MKVVKIMSQLNITFNELHPLLVIPGRKMIVTFPRKNHSTTLYTTTRKKEKKKSKAFKYLQRIKF